MRGAMDLSKRMRSRSLATWKMMATSQFSYEESLSLYTVRIELVSSV